MATQSAVEARTKNFYDWEFLGRGWCMYGFPVALEPVFRPFPGHILPFTAVHDDARKLTAFSGLWDRIFVSEGTSDVGGADDDRADEPAAAHRTAELAELEILIPHGTKIDSAVSEAWLRAASATSGTVAFELVASAGRVTVCIATDNYDASILREQLASFVPAAITRVATPLEDLWQGTGGSAYGAIEFGLAREFMLPLRTLDNAPDPLTALVGALAGIRAGEIAVLQVLLEPARNPWAVSALRAVTNSDGTPFFLDAPNLSKLAEEKCSTPFYCVAIRAAVRSGDEDRTWDVMRRIGGALGQYGAPDRNELVPLASDDLDRLIEDILARETHRSGMILSLEELSSIVRLPGDKVASAALVRVPKPLETLPQEVLGKSGVVLGEAKHREAVVPLHLSAEARQQHVYVVGGTGTGKSTLLENLILQDIHAGDGVGVLDPHGDLVDAILARIPEHRTNDVVLFDPADPDAIVGWNILGAHSDVEKDLLASDLVAVFRRLSTSWGDQMNVLLANAIMAFLESDRGGTLSDLRRFLLDDTYRQAFLATVTDDHVVSFWQQEFPLLAGKRPQAPILTRLDTFLRSRLVREAVTEQKKPLNFRSIIDDSSIFLAKLSQGAIGEENAALLGSVLVSKFHQVSLSRQDTAVASRTPFYLYIDEFQHMATPSMASLFSGVRKYRLSLTVAHQDLYQLHAEVPEVERALLANAYTRIIFRVSDEDARKFEKSITGFTADDLANLGRGSAICRVGRKDNAFRLKTYPLDEMLAPEADGRREEVRAASLSRFGRPRDRSEPRSSTSTSRPQSSRATSQQTTDDPSKTRVLDPASLPGRGGAVHKYVQGLIKEWARTHGYRCEIEMQLPDGKRVDVALSRGEQTIACEIAGTTTIEQELGNVQKCLNGPFRYVMAVSLDRKFLGSLEEALNSRLSKKDLERVRTVSPEEFLAFLQARGPETAESRVRGYSVTVRKKSGIDVDDDMRKRVVADVMLKSAQRMRKKP